MKSISGQWEHKIQAEEISQSIGKEIILYGSIYKIRIMSSFAFVLLRMSRNIIQCIYNKEYSEISLEQLKENSCIRLMGLVTAEPRSKTGYEIRILSAEILSEAVIEPPLVINNKVLGASLETVLDYHQIAMRNEKERAVFKLQEGIVRGFRLFLEKNNFTEIHSPKIVFAGAEGGANIFKLNYFGKEAYLAQSPQFYKQMMAGVFDRVFEIGQVYRAEKHDTSRHLNEYTGVDFELGYINSFEEIMEYETRMLQEMFEYLQKAYASELLLLNVSIPDTSQIPCIKFSEAKQLISNKYQRRSSDPYDFEPEEERLLCEWVKKSTGSEFIFVTHYPTSKRPFYAMECSKNREETLSFDLLFRGIEITTGGQRIHDYKVQKEKMLARNMDLSQFESYLLMHRCGMPPHGGLGLGLERFTMKLLNQENIRCCSMFPRDIHRLEP